MKFEDFKPGQKVEMVYTDEEIPGIVERVSATQVFIKWEDGDTDSHDWDDPELKNVRIKTDDNG